MSDHAQHNDDSHGHGLHAHVMPMSTLLGTFTALLVLTGLTVAIYEIDFGAIDIWVAMGIATVKATLVAVYFMHLRYEKPFITLSFLFSLAFVALFISVTLMDAKEYEPQVEALHNSQMQEAAE
ncbi:cytochrome C oxidase subunit IV family protein [Blastopirellula sp. J2-11]|uniref:cytochrome C oxidase subunit IV family protein n=1 Tax=Blastopirellula sp. J2-11 TaxID=2943192 RepID=UPI0021C73D10|nr:cytochrome C oxidase subunit IV family protein [Blastopirellula sp. J2-11]UUO04881.1 cytochrome C oxidase subunit IV family protein [Blastopirellula sp. J2-11]